MAVRKLGCGEGEEKMRNCLQEYLRMRESCQKLRKVIRKLKIGVAVLAVLVGIAVAELTRLYLKG